MVKLRWLSLIVLCLMLVGCAAKNANPQLSVVMPTQVVSSESFAPLDKSAAGSSTSNSTGSSTDTQRLVITNASLSIIVDDPAKTVDFITNLAATLNGYVVSSNLTKYTNSNGVELPAANITIRVPAEKLANAMTQVKAQVKDPLKDIQSEVITGQDVTKEYTDLQSQLTNLQQAEAQLKQIMASATKTEDVLNVFNQLTQIQSQIEVLQGQIKYYQESAALSSLSVEIVAQASIQPLTVGGWQPQGIARNAIQALIDGLQFLANAAIWGVLFCLPIFIVIAVPVWVIVKLVRRWRNAHKKGKAQPVTTTPAV
jgi:hypothetical protein